MRRVLPRRMFLGLALTMGVAGLALFGAPTTTYARQFVTPCHGPASQDAQRHLLVRVDSCRSGHRPAPPVARTMP